MLSATLPISTPELLAGDELLIVPSEGIARALRNSFDKAQQRAGHRVWQPTPVLSWDQWLHSLWSECVLTGAEERLLLNDAQEHQLWRDIVSRTSPAEQQTLASADSLADMASAAWRLAEAHRATDQLRSYAATYDARTFATWAEEFSRMCRRGGFLSRSSLEAALAHHTQRRAFAVPPHLRLLGFQNQTPAQEACLEAFRAAGCEIEQSPAITMPGPSAERSVLCASGEEEELRAAALWIRSYLEDAAPNNEPPQIALIVPYLNSERDAVDAILREVLAPELQLVSADLSSHPYEFHAGKPLASHPMITSAMNMLHWANSGSLTLNSVSSLILSPYLMPAESRETCAQFDACALRSAKLLRPEIQLPWLVRLAQRSEFGTAPLAWLLPMQTFLTKAGSLQAPRAFADWAEFMRRLVRSSGWPGKPSSATELELARAWDHALDTVATLDFSSRRVSFAEALQALERQVTEVSLRDASGQAPVQVLRPSDLPGMTFDALVFVRATDTNWPVAERTNPLMDWKLQVSLGMPGTSREEAAERSRLATEAILQSAGSVLFTYAANNAEGKQWLSPAVAKLGWPQLSAADILSSSPAAEHIEAEAVHDDTSLPPLPTSRVHGGASVLQHQAACGFRAFAEIRLRAGELESQETGLDARERGDLLHRAMSHFWTKIHTQAELRSLPEAKRQELLAHCIDEAFGTGPHLGESWGEAYITLQKQRLLNLLTQWLEHELKRGPFTVVSTELKQEISVGPLDLQVRVDRIDRVDNMEEGVLLVDYKTGATAEPRNWLGDRPDEPQLPLYALLPEAGTLAGLAFAKVRPGDTMSWQGYAADEGILPGRNVTRDLPLLLEDWRAHLTTLAEAFFSGDARVQPKQHPVTCAHCGQRLLCRLDAATLLAVSDSNETAEESSSDG